MRIILTIFLLYTIIKANCEIKKSYYFNINKLPKCPKTIGKESMQIINNKMSKQKISACKKNNTVRFMIDFAKNKKIDK